MLHLMYRTISVPYSTLSIIVSFRKTFHAGQAHSNVLSLFCICINDNNNACCLLHNSVRPDPTFCVIKICSLVFSWITQRSLGCINFNQLEKLEAAKAAWPVYLCLLGLTWPYWALLGLTGPYWALTGPYRALLNLTGPYWASLALNGPYWALLGLTGSFIAFAY